MTNKLSNEEKVKRVKIRKILLFFIFIFAVLTIILSIYSLVFKKTPLFALIAFIIEALLTRYRNKLDPKVVNLDSKNQE